MHVSKFICLFTYTKEPINCITFETIIYFLPIIFLINYYLIYLFHFCKKYLRVLLIKTIINVVLNFDKDK